MHLLKGSGNAVSYLLTANKTGRSLAKALGRRTAIANSGEAFTFSNQFVCSPHLPIAWKTIEPVFT
jgi:hypothetical protein